MLILTLKGFIGAMLPLLGMQLRHPLMGYLEVERCPYGGPETTSIGIVLKHSPLRDNKV